MTQTVEAWETPTIAVMCILAGMFIMGVVLEADSSSVSTPTLDAVCVQIYGEGATFVDKFGYQGVFECEKPFMGVDDVDGPLVECPTCVGRKLYGPPFGVSAIE